MNLKQYLDNILKLPTPEQLKKYAIDNHLLAEDYFKKLDSMLKTKRDYYLMFVKLIYIGYIINSRADNQGYFIEPLEDTILRSKKIPKIHEKEDNPSTRKTYRLLKEEIEKIIKAVKTHQVKDRREDLNRILYAMLKTQDRFGFIDEAIPNTLNMLSCLKDLDFINFENKYAATKSGNARSVVEKVLPYSIACGKTKANSIEERVEARLVGHEILICLNNLFYGENNNDPYSLFNIEQVVDTKTAKAIVKRFQEKNGSRLLTLMNAIRTEAYAALESDSLGQGNEAIYPISLIYACSNLGEEDPEPLFSMSTEELKERLETLKKERPAKKIIKSIKESKSH